MLCCPPLAFGMGRQDFRCGPQGRRTKGMDSEKLYPLVN